jgi:hypothetical protein
MYRLTTFEKIGEEYNLPDDIIDRMSEFYIQDCLSYENTLKYYTDRNIILLNNHYHLHRIKMYLVDCEFKNNLRSYLSYKNLLYSNNLNDIIYINQHSDYDMMMQYESLFNLSLDNQLEIGIGDFINYLKM